jgi:hypothetical protein
LLIILPDRLDPTVPDDHGLVADQFFFIHRQDVDMHEYVIAFLLRRQE